MKTVTVAAVMLLMISSAAWAQISGVSGDAECHVYGTVNTALAVTPVGGSVSIGTVTPDPMGEAIGTAICTFNVHANVQELEIQICATDLYKGDSPQSTHKINLVKDPGALVTNVNGRINPMGGVSNELPFDATPTGNLIHGLPEFCTQSVMFSSGTIGTFSEDVDIEVEYSSSDTELPQGEYSGYIKFIVLII